jgi:hypothetical protein
VVGRSGAGMFRGGGRVPVGVAHLEALPVVVGFNLFLITFITAPTFTRDLLFEALRS